MHDKILDFPAASGSLTQTLLFPVRESQVRFMKTPFLGTAPSNSRSAYTKDPFNSARIRAVRLLDERSKLSNAINFPIDTAIEPESLFVAILKVCILKHEPIVVQIFPKDGY